MKNKLVVGLFTVLAVVLVSYGTSSAQIVEKAKDIAEKTKDVTVETTKKTAVIVTDGLEKASDKTKDLTVDTAKTAASSSKKFGNNAVEVTENIAVKSYEGGKWFTVTTWDGTKWVSKRTWIATKKAAGAASDAVVGSEENKPK